MVPHITASLCNLKYLRGHALAHCCSQSTLGGYLKLLEVTSLIYTVIRMTLNSICRFILILLQIVVVVVESLFKHDEI